MRSRLRLTEILPSFGATSRLEPTSAGETVQFLSSCSKTSCWATAPWAFSAAVSASAVVIWGPSTSPRSLASPVMPSMASSTLAIVCSTLSLYPSRDSPTSTSEPTTLHRGVLGRGVDLAGYLLDLGPDPLGAVVDVRVYGDAREGGPEPLAEALQDVALAAHGVGLVDGGVHVEVDAELLGGAGEALGAAELDLLQRAHRPLPDDLPGLGRRPCRPKRRCRPRRRGGRCRSSSSSPPPRARRRGRRR